jgi:heparin binding hemagglutinin HbhA
MEKECVMALISEIRKNVTDATPLLAVVGVTDLAAERVREAAAGAGHLQQEVEKSYEHLAERGRGVVERARQAAPTQDFLRQGKATLGRAQAAVTSARKAVDDTVAAARDTLAVGRREAREAVGAVEAVAGQIGEEPRTPAASEPVAPAEEAGAAPAEEVGAAPAEEAGDAR